LAPMAILKEYIRRYTSISATIDMLHRKQIVLLDPEKWEDRNDRYFMQLYRERQNVRSIYGLCASRSSETDHHWRVFTKADEGVCIELKRAPLEKVLKRMKKKGIQFGDVKYMLIRDLKKLSSQDFSWLPFVKRDGFRDEVEYRIIAENHEEQETTYPIDIKLSWINRIEINPWLPDTILGSVVATLKRFPGCADVAIRRSRLIDNSRWKKAGHDVVGRTSAMPPKLER
jgi:hypothetical protein